LIGHGVVMEGNRKKTGCLQAFGGHCITACFEQCAISDDGKE